MRLIAAALLLVLAACLGPQGKDPLSVLERCGPGDRPSGAYCGKLEVFEDRAAGTGRKIALETVLLPAFSNDPAPDPVFFLVGGPGQAAAKLSGQIYPLFDGIRRRRDVVLVDQRGTGDSNGLDCEFEDDPFTEDFSSELIRRRFTECWAEWDADLRLYTTPIAMDDLDDVRQWLGYDQVNLVGGSYGTRAALVYLRRHEDRVRSVVLDGVAPTNMALPLYFARDAQQALDRLFEACTADPACAERYPNLSDTADRLLARLDEPERVPAVHPRTGARVTPNISRDEVASSLTGMLYSPWLSALGPLAIEAAAGGNFGPLFALGGANEQRGSEMSQGMFFSVMCSEDRRLLDPQSIKRETAATFLRDSLFRTRWGPCEYWPQGEAPPEYFEPVSSNKPTLLLSGALDPVTPPSWAEQAAATLSNSKSLVAQGVGHGVMGVGCGIKIIESFLADPRPAAVDGSCLDEIERPPFFLSPVAPMEAAE